MSKKSILPVPPDGNGSYEGVAVSRQKKVPKGWGGGVAVVLGALSVLIALSTAYFAYWVLQDNEFTKVMFSPSADADMRGYGILFGIPFMILYVVVVFVVSIAMLGVGAIAIAIGVKGFVSAGQAPVRNLYLVGLVLGTIGFDVGFLIF